VIAKVNKKFLYQAPASKRQKMIALTLLKVTKLKSENVFIVVLMEVNIVFVVVVKTLDQDMMELVAKKMKII
jgi:hypothetical protein